MSEREAAHVERGHFLPLYEQVKENLLTLIDDGQLEPGDQLPSEKELERQYDVSRVTVRRALQELSHEGRIVRVAGKGSFVLQPKIEPLSALTSFSENMEAQGYQPSYSDSETSLVVPTPKIRDLLGLGESDKTLLINRLMLADGLPMAIQKAYLPNYIYLQAKSFLTPEVLNNISLYKILELEAGIRLYRAEEWVDASKALPEEALMLDIETGDSLLVIERLTFSTEEKPVEYVKLIFPAGRYRYKVELFRPQ